MEERERCQQLNLRLREIEAWARTRALAVEHDLCARVEDPDDPVSDFELDLKLDFQLREDDSAFRMDDDNYIASQSHPLGGNHFPPSLEDQRYCIGNPQHWRSDSDPELSAGEAAHCLSFHELRELGRLSWHDVARIGPVFAEVVIREQLHRS
jgi:hypothetical protein